MIRDDVVAELIAWQTRPLCCRYAVVLFDSVRLRIVQAGASRASEIHFAIGMVPDGSHEVLGLWVESVEQRLCWRGVFEDLKRRGVTSMHSVIGARSARVRRAVLTVYPQARVHCPSASCVLPSRRRRGLLHAQETVEVLHARAQRRGAFADELAATVFVWRAQVARARHVRHASARTQAQIGGIARARHG